MHIYEYIYTHTSVRECVFVCVWLRYKERDNAETQNTHIYVDILICFLNREMSQ